MGSPTETRPRVRRHRLTLRRHVAGVAFLVAGAAVALPQAAGASFTYPTLPGATVGQPYSAQIPYSDASGGPYTFTVTYGEVPAGLSVSSSGLVSGVPQQQADAPDTFWFRATVSDSNNPGQVMGDVQPSITVTPPGYTPPPQLTLSPSSIPEATVGHPYSVTLQAGGGTPPYSWSEAGPLPQGFTFSDGTISGQSDTVQKTTFTVTVQDAGTQNPSPFQTINEGQTAQRTYTLTVSSGVSALDPTLLSLGGEEAALSSELNGQLGTVQFVLSQAAYLVQCWPEVLDTLLYSAPPSC